jgi:L-threonylcarbamoyladenylate synthase
LYFIITYVKIILLENVRSKMKTIVVKTSADNINMNAIQQAGKIIREGGLVAFPTETVYGLGADALNEAAAAKIYAAKGRPSDNPLIAHIADISMLEPLVKEIPEVAERLMKAFWPGPMTLIFQKSDLVPEGTTGGLDTVAVRFPNHPIARELIKEAGVSIAAPSANLSGKPSPTLGEHVIDDMDGRIDMIIDGGAVGMGLESTIIDVTVTPPMILRPGFITEEMIKEVVGEVSVDKAIFSKPEEGLKPKAPGMKYRHYAPSADYKIYRGDAQKVAEQITLLANEKANAGMKTGIITADQHKNLYEGKLDNRVIVVSMGDLEKPETIAAHLFKVLRDFDKMGAEYIYGEAFSEDNVGQAIMNRLTKAAGYNIIDV